MVRRYAVIASRSMLIALAVSSPAFAQDVREAEAPAHISLVEGVAVLERDGRTDDAPANMPLLAGDRVRTRAGRVEILFADGSTLHLDHNSAVDLQSDELVRLLDGRLRLSIPTRARDVSYRIDGPHAWAQISQPGEYRAAVIQNAGLTELEFAVLRGAAELMNEGGRTTLRAGERAFARADAAPSHAYVFNSASFDPFDRWSEARRSERLGVSAQYLPDEVRPYAGALDRYGSWQYESSYGYVWYPRVDHGWRPYYHGRWSSLRPYGWTWIGADPWGWPTHHYGRWGFSSRGSWYWIPGRAWAPAWVSWAHAPGYVSWCPLGFNNRPVFQIVNVHGGFDPWRGWTVLPQRDFGVGFVHRRVLVGSAIDARTRSAFVHRDSSPVVTGFAVPRGSAAAPIRVAGTAGARRGVSPLLTNRATAPSDADRSTAPSRAIDITRRPSSSTDNDRGTISGGRERTMPTRPVVRSERGVRATRPSQPAVEYTAPREDRRIRTSEPAARPDGYPAGVSRSPSGFERRQPSVDRPASGNPRAIERRPPSADPPSSGRPPAGERRQPGIERSTPSAPPAAPPSQSSRPERTAPTRSAPPPSAAPPSGAGGRSGGNTPSRGTAVRRPGGRG
jgi:hypothetical protein